MGSRIRLRLLVCAYTGAVFFGGDVTLRAQSGDREVVPLPSYEVTGSRLRTIEQAAFLPVLRYDASVVERSGTASLADFLQALPFSSGAVYRGARPSANSGATSTVNFRGLGGNNALLLLDGRRLPRFPQPDDAALNYDVANLPESAIEAVEVLPQGAAAVYGSDAVSGVINFRSRKNFRGAFASARYSQFQDTDWGRQEYTVSQGLGWSRGWLLLSADFATQNDVLFRDRPVSVSEDHRPVGHDYRQNGGLPGQVRLSTSVAGLPSAWTNDGTWLTLGTTVNGVLLRTGPTKTPRLVDFVALPAGDLDQNGNLRSGATTNGLDRAEWASVIPAERTWGMSAMGEWKLSESVTAFAQAFYRCRKTKHRLHPALANLEDESASGHGDGPNGEVIFPRTNPYNPFGVDVRALQFHLAELGGRRRTFDHESPWVCGGIRGELSSDWDWEVAVTANGSRLVETSENQMTDVDLQAGLAGRLGGFINPFGPSDSGVMDRARTSWTMEQEFNSLGTDARVRGLLWSLPGGPFQLCLGGELRRERFRSEPEPAAARGDFVSWGELPLVHLSRHTSAGFFEVVAPVTKSVDVQVAGRVERSGNYSSALRPSVAAAWRAAPWVTLRGSAQETFKAPEMLEVGGGVIEVGTNIVDPRRPDLGSYPVRVRTGSNADLRSERGCNWSVGAKLALPNRTGVSFEVDWWRLEKSDVVTSVGWPFLLEHELNSSFPTAERIHRQATLPDGRAGPVLWVDDVRFNIDRVMVSGADFAAQWDFRLTPAFKGRVRWQATWLGESRYVSASYGTIDRLGRSSVPRWRSFGTVELEHGKAALSITGNYLGSQRSGPILAGQPDWVEDGQVTTNVVLSWQCDPKTRVALTVANAFDVDPPSQPAYQRGYDADFYSNYGRSFSVRIVRDWR